jgi:hypothetical protein
VYFTVPKKTYKGCLKPQATHQKFLIIHHTNTNTPQKDSQFGTINVQLLDFRMFQPTNSHVQEGQCHINDKWNGH